MAKTKMPRRTTTKSVETKKTRAAAEMTKSTPKEKRLPELANYVMPITLEDEIRLEEEIRQRAYELWEQCGRETGRENEHWLIAEREVRTRHSEQSYSA